MTDKRRQIGKIIQKKNEYINIKKRITKNVEELKKLNENETQKFQISL